MLYGTIDASGFYRNPVAVDCRSWMNVPFTLPNAELDKPFLEGARKAGLVALEGHRSVGGMRASIYNAMPLAGVQALVELHEGIPAELTAEADRACPFKILTLNNISVRGLERLPRDRYEVASEIGHPDAILRALGRHARAGDSRRACWPSRAPAPAPTTSRSRS